MESAKFQRAFFFCIFLFLVSYGQLFSKAQSSEAVDTIRRMMLLANYISGDYKEAVSNSGEILNPLEYDEMLEFSESMKNMYQKSFLSDKSVFLQIDTLGDLIRKKEKPQLVKNHAKLLVQTFKDVFQLTSDLNSHPDIKKGKLLYESYCASCHASSGNAKTSVAKALEPPPRNLIESEFYQDLSPARVYNTLKLGLDGTSMISYDKILSEEDKWSVAFYVTSLPFVDENPMQTRSHSEDINSVLSSFTWSSLADLSSSQMKSKLSSDYKLQGVQLLRVFASLRTLSFDPQKLALNSVKRTSKFFQKNKTPLGGLEALRYTRQRLQSLIDKDNKEPLAEEILDIYLEGFEEFERDLKIVAPDKRLPIEKKFMALRQMSKELGAFELVKQKVAEIDGDLYELESLFISKKEGKNFSLLSEVLASVTIIVREGLEAFLIVMALLSLVENLGLRRAKVWIHSAWILATFLGFGTYYLMNKVFEISGSNRELMEGALTGVAVIMLFYTGFWLLSQANSRKWNHFVKGESQNKLSQGDLLTFFGLAFVAVYREAAETVLFYGALLNASQSKFLVILGFFIGVFFLLCLCLGLLYFNIKIQMAQFFKLTSSLMFLLSFVLSGKAVYELIESGYLEGTYFENIPRVEALGLYPFFETLMAQGVLLIFTILLLLRHKTNTAAVGREKKMSAAKPLKT